MESRPGTVEHFHEHERCYQEMARLRMALEEIASICDGRDDASIEADGAVIPNGYMEIHLIAMRAVRR